MKASEHIQKIKETLAQVEAHSEDLDNLSDSYIEEQLGLVDEILQDLMTQAEDFADLALDAADQWAWGDQWDQWSWGEDEE